MAADRSSRLPDVESRRRAATDFTTNLIVLAGAGTGKTSLLVERALNAIASGVATMDEIAAITFTEKAAGEMRQRLAVGLDRLRALARSETDLDDRHEADRAYRHLTGERAVDADEVAARALAAMEALDHGTVVTIHGFCAEILRSFPFEAGVDPGFAVDSGESFESLRETLWENFVGRELGAGGKRVEAWVPVLSRLGLGPIAIAARGLASFSIPAELLQDRGSITPEEIFSAEAASLAEEIGSLMRRQSGMPGKGTTFFTGIREALEAFCTDGLGALRKRIDSDPKLPSWLESASGLPKGRDMKKLEGVRPEDVDRLARQARELVVPLRAADDALMRDVVELVAPFALEFRESYLRHGWVGFNGLLALTRDLLRDQPEVRRRLKRRYRMLLVDEFQDTDPLQYEIVLFLAEDPADEAPKAFEARLQPGRLFIVGDAKQSIYRFRGADYGAYRRAIDRVVDAGGVRLDLTGNFRSVPGVLDPVNRLFTAADGCWHESTYQTPYVPIVPVREDDADAPVVELWTVDCPGAKASERRAAEGRVIAEAIARWVEVERRCRYEDITILFRAFTSITHYLRPLREMGIPFVVDGGREFLKRPEVSQLMATLRALSQPANQPALLAFLRSPAGGVSDRQLHAYARDGGRWSWRLEPDAETFPDIARSFATLRQLESETRHLPVDAFVRRALANTLLLPLGAAAFEGPQRVANLQKLAAAAGELARDGRLSLEEVVEALEEGRLEDIETDRPLADDAAAAVRITNIHRMKGLENDVVVLPDLARQRMHREPEPPPVKLATLPDGRVDLGLMIGGIGNTGRAWYDRENHHHGNAEEVRVLYVAMTRARERLVVLAGPSRGAAPWVEALAPWGYDAGNPPVDGAPLCDGAVKHRLLEVPSRRKLSRTQTPYDTEQAVRLYGQAREALESAAKRPIASPSGLHEERDDRLAAGGGWLPPSVRDAADVGKAAGSVLHRLLEGWDGADVELLRARLVPLCDETALESGVDPDAVRCEAGAILDAFLGTELPGRLATIERLGREVPVLVRDDSHQVFRGSIDLLYRDGGEIVVADYKTDRNRDASSLQTQYGRQLAVYAGAVREAMELTATPRTELWLLRTGEILRLR